MDNYKKLQAVKGLLFSMEEQLNNYFQKDNLPSNVRDVIVNEYYKAIVDFLTPNRNGYIEDIYKKGLISQEVYKELINEKA